jgi:hypothetical protein
MGGSTNLDAALQQANREYVLSTQPNNKKEIWIITDGDYADPSGTAITAQQLRREKQATIYAIGVGVGISKISLEKVATAGCAFLVNNFESALNLVKQKITPADLSVQTSLSILLPPNSYKLGETVFFTITVENVGQNDIEQKSRIIFQENTFFKTKDVKLPQTLKVGQEISIDFKLTPKIQGSINLEHQIMNLPHVLDFVFLDNHNNEVVVDCTGYLLQHEHFAGDIFEFQPVYTDETITNILLFGPPGAGKSTFVNSILTALSESIYAVNVAGGTAKVVTQKLEQFPIHKIPGFEKLKFAIYDVPGIDSGNYKGDEISLLVHGIMPLDITFKTHAVKYSDVNGRRASPAEEWKQRIHLVAFFVPQGIVDSAAMDKLAEVYTDLTVELKRKAVVVIAHADELEGNNDRMQVSQDICKKLAIGNSSVYFLENYVSAKEKQFLLDKQIIQIILASLNYANDFLIYERQNPIVNPYGKPTQSKAKN